MNSLRFFWVTTLVIGGLSVAANHSQAAMPLGSISYTNTSATNALWDVTKVSQLQNLNASVSKLGAAVQFSVLFTEDAAGKLGGAGLTSITVNSYAISGTLPQALYKVVGTIRSKDGEATVRLIANVSTVAVIEGKSRVVKATAARTVQLDSVNKTLSGQFRNSLSASGLGGGSEAGDITDTWADIQSAIGDGSWTLSLSLSDAGSNKLGGSALLTMKSGLIWSYDVKGVYIPKTDATKLVLVPTLASKGSTLKAQLLGSRITGIQGKVCGQTIKLSADQ